MAFEPIETFFFDFFSFAECLQTLPHNFESFCVDNYVGNETAYIPIDGFIQHLVFRFVNLWQAHKHKQHTRNINAMLINRINKQNVRYV